MILLLDEWQKYSSRLTGTMLAKSRKFNMRLILANQNFSQLEYRLRDSVLSNTGAVGCFRLGPADAVLIDGLFPTISVRTLQTLPPHTVALTTFDVDAVSSGPVPLKVPSDEPRAWAEQLKQFWGGAEPPHARPARGQAGMPGPRPDQPAGMPALGSRLIHRDGP